MFKKALTMFFLFTLISFSLFPLSSQAQNTQDASYWTISQIEGKAFLKRKDADVWMACRTGMKLFEGDSIKTETASNLNLVIHTGKDEDFTKVFENTEMTLSKYEKKQEDQEDILLDLVMGEVLVNVENMPKGSDFKVKTPTAITGVRGTKFDVRLLESLITEVLVLQGKVFLGNLSQFIEQKVIELSQGEHSAVKPDEIPDLPQDLDPDTQKQYEEMAEQIIESIKDIDMEALTAGTEEDWELLEDGDEIIGPDGKKYIYSKEQGGFVGPEGEFISMQDAMQFSPGDSGYVPQDGDEFIGPDGKKYIFDEEQGGWVGPDGEVVTDIAPMMGPQDGDVMMGPDGKEFVFDAEKGGWVGPEGEFIPESGSNPAIHAPETGDKIIGPDGKEYVYSADKGGWVGPEGEVIPPNEMGMMFEPQPQTGDTIIGPDGTEYIFDADLGGWVGPNGEVIPPEQMGPMPVGPQDGDVLVGPDGTEYKFDEDLGGWVTPDGTVISDAQMMEIVPPGDYAPETGDVMIGPDGNEYVYDVEKGGWVGPNGEVIPPEQMGPMPVGPQDGDVVVGPDGTEYKFDEDLGGWVTPDGTVISDQQMMEIVPPTDGFVPETGDVMVGPDGTEYVFDADMGGWVGPDGTIVQPEPGFTIEGQEPMGGPQDGDIVTSPDGVDYIFDAEQGGWIAPDGTVLSDQQMMEIVPPPDGGMPGDGDILVAPDGTEFFFDAEAGGWVAPDGTVLSDTQMMEIVPPMDGPIPGDYMGDYYDGGYIDPTTGVYVYPGDPNYDPNLAPEDWYDPAYDDGFNPFGEGFIDPSVPPPPPDYTGAFFVQPEFAGLPDSFDYPINIPLECFHQNDWQTGFSYVWSIEGATGPYITGSGKSVTLVIPASTSETVFEVKCVVTDASGNQGYGYLTIDQSKLPAYLYVSPSSGADTNDGSSTAPFASIGKAVTTAQNLVSTAELVVIWLEPTTYNVTSTITLPPTTWLVNWSSYGAGNATLDGNNSGITLISYTGDPAKDLNEFQMKGVVLQDAGTGLLVSNANFLGENVVIDDMTFNALEYSNNTGAVASCEFFSNSIIRNCPSGEPINISGSQIQFELFDTTFQNNDVTVDDVIMCTANNIQVEMQGVTFTGNDGCASLLFMSGSNASLHIQNSIFSANTGCTRLLSVNLSSPNELKIFKSRFNGNTCNNEMLDLLGLDQASFEGNLVYSNSSSTSPLIDFDANEVNFFFNTLDNNSGGGSWVNYSGTNAYVDNNAFTSGTATQDAFTGTISERYNGIMQSAGLNGNGNFSIGTNGNIDLTQSQAQLYVSPGSDYTPSDNPSSSQLIDSGGTSAQILEDYQGNPRPMDGDSNGTAQYDIGCIEYQDGADPVIRGTIYDSVTGERVGGTTIALYPKDSQTVEGSALGSAYSFNVLPGWFKIIVNKTGYYFPSSIKEGVTPGDHGEDFVVLDGVDQVIDIPIDNSPYLVINKTVNKKKATVGEILTFNVQIQNTYWFADVTDVKLHDAAVGGLSYINGSTVKSSVSASDPVRSGKNLVFDVGTIPAGKSVNVSYQMIIPTGLSYGRYASEAVCRDANSSEQISNTDSAPFEVVPDPLFTLGTVLGKVFADNNDNGVQDKGEQGLSDIILSTEYGIEVITDENGMYHIPNVIKGRHLVKIDEESLPEGYRSSDTHGKYFEMTEGGHTKVSIPVIKGEPEKKEDFFIVGLGEITLRQNEFSGNLEMVEKDDTFDDGFSSDGRAAFYLRGKIKGKYLIRSSFDSKRMSKEQKYFHQYRLFTNLDPEKYYPIYGDSSKIDYSATETTNMLYVLVEWDESFAKWGNLEIDMPRYRRATSGGMVHYTSLDATRFGQKKLEAQAFYAISDHQSSHEEFIGTGGSIYLLGENYVIEGSEKVKVEFRDRLTKSPLKSIELVEEVDYQIDYDSGRITLTRPLSSSYFNYKHTIISNDVTSGAQPVLIVEYEYEALSLLSRDSYGGRVDKTLGDHIKVGLQGAEETRTGDDYQLVSGDVTFTLNPLTSLTASYSDSKGSFQGGGISYDGGVTMTSQEPDFKDGEKGAAYDISANTAVLDNKLNASLGYTHTDPGFSALGSLTEQGTEQYTAEAAYDIKENISTGITHVTTDSLGANEITKAVSVVNRTHTTNLFVEGEKDKWDGRVEYQHQDAGDVFGGIKYLGTLPPRGEHLLAGRVGYRFTEDVHAYSVLQSAIEGETNDQVTIGTVFPIFRNTDIALEGKTGTIGNSAGVHLKVDKDTEEESYISFQTGNYDDDERYQTVSFTKNYLLSENATMKFSKDYSYFNEQLLNGNVMDSEIRVNNLFSIGISYEQNTVDTGVYPESISREAASLRYSLIDPGLIQNSGKFEWREDKNNSTDAKVRHFYFEDKLLYRYGENLSLTFKGGLGFATNLASNSQFFDFTELSTGFAYRPVRYDRFNLLGKYSFIHDVPLSSKTSFVETMKAKKHVFAFGGTYDIIPSIQLSGKLAYRMMEEKVGVRDWQDSNTCLFLTGLLFEFMENWGVFSEYRILSNQTADDRKQGFLCDVRRNIRENFYICAGYNFTDFDDDLTNTDDYDNHGFFIRIVGRY